MKRPILVAAMTLAAAITTSVQAQEKTSKPHSKFYLKATGGYFFSITPGQFPNVGPYPPQDLHTQYNPANANPLDTLSRKVLTGSYGQGARGGLSVGYNINKYIAVEASFNYYQSSKNLMTNTLTTVVGTNQVLAQVTSHGHVHAFDFAPSVVFSPGYEKINPYVRFGVVLPLWGRLVIETDALNTSTPPAGAPLPPGTLIRTEIHRTEEVKPNITIGMQGALGVDFNLSPRFDVFVEAEYRNVPVKSKSKEVTKYSETNTAINGATGSVITVVSSRNLDQLSVAEKNTDYVTTLDKGSNTPIAQQGTVTKYKNDNAPANDLKSYINIGGMGFNAGIKFRL
ncbi:MAG: outer membrane beta-barrel protein [Chitinophaga sp.]|uniref:outer membrane beta-barrel protein n=1 Tax=Chitinophaga sp. TaxID=1869181 RepID=UPI0025C71E4B|nr:outer membrane beta-barrel protein [Chitinophaga sp.]MBV8251073.1 outer membrane beta-barrel protein [Chitinophaga sp.]